jgi:hypothetical protein
MYSVKNHMKNLKVKVIIQARHNSQGSSYSATAYLIEPDRRPFNVVQTGSASDKASQESAIQSSLEDLRKHLISNYWRSIDIALSNPHCILIEQREIIEDSRTQKKS